MRHISPLTIFLNDPELRINRQQGHLVIRKKNDFHRKIPIIKIGMIIQKDLVSVSMDALATLMDKEIPLIYLDEQGRVLGYIESAARHDASVRLKQFEAAGIEKNRFLAARKLISSRIGNIIAMMEVLPLPGTLRGRTSGLLGELRKTALALPRARDLEMLRLMDERCDRDYSDLLGELLAGRWEFKARKRGDWPPDPVNALLDFLEMLVIQETRGILASEGLYPGRGFFRESGDTALPLALELGRPLLPMIAGRLAVELLRRGDVSENDFADPTLAIDGVHLTGEGQKKVFVSYEKRMMESVDGSGRENIPSGRSILRRQVDDFKSALMTDGLEGWKPYLFSRGGKKRE